ncbi:hypothetical protein AAZX31_01G057900 [Glycine max]
MKNMVFSKWLHIPRNRLSQESCFSCMKKIPPCQMSPKKKSIDPSKQGPISVKFHHSSIDITLDNCSPRFEKLEIEPTKCWALAPITTPHYLFYFIFCKTIGKHAILQSTYSLKVDTIKSNPHVPPFL